MRTPRLLNFSHRPISFSPTFHSPYTLPSSVASKSFACHSYENCRGVGVFLPFWNRASEKDARHACPVPDGERTQRLDGSARTLSESAAEINSPLATSRSPLTPLSATLTKMPISVDSKGFTGKLNPLDATLTKNRGAHLSSQSLLSPPLCSCFTASPIPGISARSLLPQPHRSSFLFNSLVKGHFSPTPRPPS